jgi:hypothetical protein
MTALCIGAWIVVTFLGCVFFYTVGELNRRDG